MDKDRFVAKYYHCDTREDKVWLFCSLVFVWFGWFCCRWKWASGFTCNVMSPSWQSIKVLDNSTTISYSSRERICTLPKVTPLVRSRTHELDSCLKDPQARALVSASDPGRWAAPCGNSKWAEEPLAPGIHSTKNAFLLIRVLCESHH